MFEFSRSWQVFEYSFPCKLPVIHGPCGAGTAGPEGPRDTKAWIGSQTQNVTELDGSHMSMDVTQQKVKRLKERQ